MRPLSTYVGPRQSTKYKVRVSSKSTWLTPFIGRGGRLDDSLASAARLPLEFPWARPRRSPPCPRRWGGPCVRPRGACWRRLRCGRRRSAALPLSTQWIAASPSTLPLRHGERQAHRWSIWPLAVPLAVYSDSLRRSLGARASRIGVRAAASGRPGGRSRPTCWSTSPSLESTEPSRPWEKRSAGAATSSLVSTRHASAGALSLSGSVSSPTHAPLTWAAPAQAAPRESSKRKLQSNKRSEKCKVSEKLYVSTFRERLERAEARGAARGQPAREERDAEQRERGGREDARIARADAVEQRRDEPAAGKRRRQAEVMPASATTPPCRTIMPATLPGSAPRARRTPISPVRWLTM